MNFKNSFDHKIIQDFVCLKYTLYLEYTVKMLKYLKIL